MYFEKIVNVQTGEETMREFTPEEVVELELRQAELKAQADEALAKEQARKETLESIGLTEEQIQALLG